MIYTSYEMIRDCRAGNPDGLMYFVRHYVPVLRAIAAHYETGRSVEDLLPGIPAFVQSLEPAPERPFVAALRQYVLQGESAPADVDLESLSAAFESLTLTERLAAWFETMRYPEADTARMLRMSAATAGAIRERAAELLRAHLDTWRRDVLQSNGAALGHAAAAAKTAACLPPKLFLDVIDGRATWRGREEMEGHVKSCWHCIDHYCRLLEVVDLMRAARPLDGPEAEKYLLLLGISPRRKSRAF